MGEEKKVDPLEGIEVVIEGEGGETVIGDAKANTAAAGDEAGAAGGDEAGAAAGGDDDHEDDERLNNNEGNTEEEREAIRARRREERKQRKAAAKEREDRMARENAQLRTQLLEMSQRINQVENRGRQFDVQKVDEEIGKMDRAYDYYKGQIELGVKNADGAVVAEATEKMQAAARRREALENFKKQAVATQTNERPALDPRHISLANEWSQKRPWFNPMAPIPEQDTQVALLIDNALTAEGWRPTTKEYWDELDARLKKYLPHRYNQDHDSDMQGSENLGQQNGQRQNRQNGSPVAGSGREGNGNGNGKGKFVLSAERVAAIKEAGMWDDPDKRSQAIANYRSYDLQQQAKGAR